MNKNYALYALAAIFALVGISINADMFDFLRPEDQREVRGGAQEPTAIPGVVNVQTESGTQPEVKPLEWLTGGRGGRRGDNYHYDHYKRNYRYDDVDYRD